MVPTAASRVQDARDGCQCLSAASEEAGVTWRGLLQETRAEIESTEEFHIRTRKSLQTTLPQFNYCRGTDPASMKVNDKASINFVGAESSPILL